MIFIPASRQILNASASWGTTRRAAGVSIAAPDATKSFYMSTTIIAVFFGSITSMCIASLQIYQANMKAGRNLVWSLGENSEQKVTKLTKTLLPLLASVLIF